MPPGVSDVIVKHVMTKVKEIGDPAAAIGFIAHDELYPQQQIILHNGMLYGFVRFNLQPNGHRDTEQEAQVWMHEYLDALNVPISAEDEKQISLLTSANLPNEGTECILEGVKRSRVASSMVGRKPQLQLRTTNGRLLQAQRCLSFNSIYREALHYNPLLLIGESSSEVCRRMELEMSSCWLHSPSFSTVWKWYY